MIKILFKKINEIILVSIDGKRILFGSTLFGAKMTDIDGLQLDYRGVVLEHPDLETNYNWRAEAIRRFKDKINSMETEDEIAEYLISDLSKHGYIPQSKQRDGFRPEVFK